MSEAPYPVGTRGHYAGADRKAIYSQPVLEDEYTAPVYEDVTDEQGIVTGQRLLRRPELIGQRVVKPAEFLGVADPVIVEVPAVLLEVTPSGQALIEYDDPTHPAVFRTEVPFGDADPVNSYGGFHAPQDCPRGNA